MDNLDKISYQGYRITYDYHTHTPYSHGKGTIAENYNEARRIGLKGIGISDHGPGHLTYGVSRGDFSKMRAEIEGITTLFRDTELYLSVEANIVSGGNFLDVRKDEFEIFDYVIAGYHYGITGANSAANWISDKLGRSGRRLMVKNTEMVVGALYENDLFMLTHPGDKGPFDLDEIAKACEATNTIMEINTRHTHLTLEEIKQVMKYDVKFAVSSDAHTWERVGDAASGIKRALEAGLDMSRIVNIERIEGE